MGEDPPTHILLKQVALGLMGGKKQGIEKGLAGMADKVETLPRQFKSTVKSVVVKKTGKRIL